MATFLLVPLPRLGITPLPGMLLNTYVAGTSTPAATYTDNTGAVALPNPIQADGNGLFPAIFIQVGSTYKFYCTKPVTNGLLADPVSNLGAPIWTVDGISTGPTNANIEVTGMAAVTMVAGQFAYLSDGSGGKIAGQWYLADATNAYSSSSNWIAAVPNGITAGAVGTFRIAGYLSGLAGLSAGSLYYISTVAGNITSSPPSNKRLVGQADTTTSLVLLCDPPGAAPPIATDAVGGRLTLTSGVPITTSDVTAATSIYYTPMPGCNQVTVWNGTQLVTDVLTNQTLAIPATTSQMYDVFAFDNAGAINIEALAWTSDSARATSLSVQNGFLCKSTDATRRYVGSFRTTGVSGQCEDSLAKRYVWNYYNRVPRPMQVLESTATWNYTTLTWRQARATTSNQLDFIVGIAEVPVDAYVAAMVTNNGGACPVAVSIGLDSTSTPDANVVGGIGEVAVSTTYTQVNARLVRFVAIGRHTLVWLEISAATPTTTWYGTGNAFGIAAASGIHGLIDG